MNNMKIKDLKKAIANLPDDMDVIIPDYEAGFEIFLMDTVLLDLQGY